MLSRDQNWIGRWRRVLAVVIILAALLFVFIAPGLAITHGVPDGEDHPNVGALVLVRPDGSILQWCSGTLIAEAVFLTAAHCIEDLDTFISEFGMEVFVTFDPTIDPEEGTFYTGEWHMHPEYNGFQGPGGMSDPRDVAVIILDESPPGITPASLPTAGLLDELRAAKVLRHTRFTAVGYGAIRESNTTGFQGILENLDRNRAEQGFLSLTPAWLTLPMTPSNGNGGTCYGDSGGPHFIHLNGAETDIVASITVTGDAPCKATDKTYRMDTASARSFLANFVDLP
jgi:hypothetical protein